MAEWSIAGDCKSPDFMSTLVQIQPGAHKTISSNVTAFGLFVLVMTVGFEARNRDPMRA